MRPLIQHRSIRTQLLVLLGATVVPLVALGAHTVYEEYRARVAAAEQAVMTLAETNAIHMDRFVEDVEAVLAELARRHSGGTLSEEECHARLTAFRDLSPSVAELSEFGPDDDLLCTSSAILGPELGRRVPEREGFLGLLRERGGVVYSNPLVGWVTGTTVTVVVRGVKDEEGRTVGAVGAAVRLDRLREVLSPATLPEGAIVTVTRADDGTVVARSEEWEEWVGRAIQWGPVTEEEMLAGPGLSRTHGADGVDRLWGLAPISAPEWVVFVGVPKEGVYGPIRAATLRRGGLALTVLVLVGILAAALYRSIGASVVSVTADARSAAGRRGARIEATGPLELDQLAAEFNRTLEARERAEAELVRAERRLQESRRMEVVGHLAAGIAHDFNNLLTVIQGEASFLGEGLSEQDPRRASIVQIQEASLRASRLVSQILAVGRKDQVEPRYMDPAAHVRGMEGTLRREMGDAIEVRVHADAEVPAILMDPGRLGDVIRSLAQNSREAMPDGGRVTISVSEDEDPGEPGGDTAGTCTLIRIEDTGEGMSPEVRERVFDPFFTTKEVGRGSGLGLATVHGIVTRAGGEVVVESEPRKGTTVTVRLPAADRTLRDTSSAVREA